MERQFPAPDARPALAGHWPGIIWSTILLVLVGWQGWMTLGLFGSHHPWEKLLDAEPILSGDHPLHLYHGFLGASSLKERGSFCCYDPAFQAGYPKTPVFDSGSRPAELFLLLAGGAYRPAAYKIGVAAFCMLIPLLLAVGARGVGLDQPTTCLAVAMGLLVWWNSPCQSTLFAGGIDLLLASVAAMTQTGLLVRFDRRPSVGCWLGILITGGVGWFAQPLLFALLLPLFLTYYVSVGGRHHPVWHLALLAGLAGSVASNAFWLSDWISYWWIRGPLPLEVHLLPHRTLQSLWEAPLWGSPAERALAVALVGLAGGGVWLFNHRRQRQPARLFGIGLAMFLLLAVAGVAWEPLGRLGTFRLLGAALLFAVMPAAFLLVEAGRLLAQWSGAAWRGALLMGGLLAVLGVIFSEHVVSHAARCARSQPLEIGLGPEREALLTTLREQTTTEGRILWEDRPVMGQASRWTALLALRTGRAYLGGLDPSAGIEHAHSCFNDQVLAGRLITDWSDQDLEEFCRRYNIGWVVCWSRLAEQRFRAWSGARLAVTLHDGDGPRSLFVLQRRLSYALKDSQAQMLHADSQHITLGDVTPNADGEVILSLHYQTGMRVSPGRVQLERELDPYDPIPLVRLKLPGPVVRVTLTWEK